MVKVLWYPICQWFGAQGKKKILNLDIMLKLDKEKLWHHPHFDREIYQLEVEAIDRANLECVT
jgi:hypothetical protein